MKNGSCGAFYRRSVAIGPKWPVHPEPKGKSKTENPMTITCEWCGEKVYGTPVMPEKPIVITEDGRCHWFRKKGAPARFERPENEQGTVRNGGQG